MAQRQISSRITRGRCLNIYRGRPTLGARQYQQPSLVPRKRVVASLWTPLLSLLGDWCESIGAFRSRRRRYM